jgi:translation initiation factor 1A|tara:strand:- start:1 stop:297 length:297 start_codon:yes stop_codon:yes gene_type:complete
MGKLRLPYKPRGEMFALVKEFSGGSRLVAVCEDNKTRMVRIGGRLKKKVWVRWGDLIIIKKWVIQEDSKADLVYRYTKTQKEVLKREGMLPDNMDVKL